MLARCVNQNYMLALKLFCHCFLQGTAEVLQENRKTLRSHFPDTGSAFEVGTLGFFHQSYLFSSVFSQSIFKKPCQFSFLQFRSKCSFLLFNLEGLQQLSVPT